MARDLSEGLLSVFNRVVRTHAGRTAVSIREAGRWRDLTYAALRDRTEAVSSVLIEQGVHLGDRFLLVGPSGPEWAVALFAIWRAGGTAVPLDPSLTEADLCKLSRLAKPAGAFIHPGLETVLRRIREENPSLLHVVALAAKIGFGDAPAMDALQPKTILEEPHRTQEEIAMLVYTSGTTGEPKGVLTSFRALLFEAEAIRQVMGTHEGDRILSILPLHHLLGLTAGFLGVLWCGGEIAFAGSLLPDDFLPAMREKRVTRMLVVPRFLDLFMRRIESKLNERSPMERMLFRTAGRVPGLRRLALQGLRNEFGGSFRHFVSGGAALSAEVEAFFHRLDFPVHQGYGLTEAGPVITCNAPGRSRRGTVGKALPGVEVRIASGDEGLGEVLARGPNVMQGYDGDETATRETIDAEGWLHTGDLGRLDRDGYLVLSGRLKSLIVLGTGKKVVPEEVEEALRPSPLLKEVCVVGISAQGSGEEVCVVVVPAGNTDTGDIERDIAERARALAAYKRPSRVLVRKEPLPRTATGKVRLGEVRAWAAKQPGST